MTTISPFCRRDGAREVGGGGARDKVNEAAWAALRSYSGEGNTPSPLNLALLHWWNQSCRELQPSTPP